MLCPKQKVCMVLRTKGQKQGWLHLDEEIFCFLFAQLWYLQVIGSYARRETLSSTEL